MQGVGCRIKMEGASNKTKPTNTASKNLVQTNPLAWAE